MGLKSIIGKIGSVAPLLAKILPIPGAGIAGDLIASALGVRNDPQEIEHAINADPEALMKIRQVEMDHKADLARMASELEIGKIREVNATMRTESVSEHWPQWAWRPIWGMVSALAFLVLCVFVCMLAWKAINQGDMNAIAMIPQLIISFTGLFGIPAAILGVASWHRGKEKRLRAGEQSQSGLMGRLKDIEALLPGTGKPA